MPKPPSPESGIAYDIASVAEEMRHEGAYDHQEGHAARTLVRTQDLRVVLVVLREGARLAEHSVGATAIIQVVSGQVRLRLPRVAGQPEERFEALSAGRLLVLDAGLEHDLEALADSVVLLTLGWPARAS
jgi:quercetin dioxygenase-like cupin family protein